MFAIKNSQKGMLLIDAVVGIAMFTLAFVALFGVLNMSTMVIINTKSRIGALALANEQLEYLRSLSYDNVGTSGGIPSGSVPQNETIVLNSVTYNRHTEVIYVDDPADGMGYSGSNPDTNAILNDYKKAAVTVSWNLMGHPKSLITTTSIVPKSAELDCVNCGSILIHTRDMNSAAVPGASVTLTSSTVIPAINLTRITDPNGDVNFIGVPVGPAGNTYHVVVTSDGYSTDQTYTANGVNTNPNPADFSVFDNQTVEATFRIDYLGSKTINTYKTPVTVTWNDTFADSSNISALNSTVVVSGEVDLLETEGVYAADGSVFSHWITPQYLSQWTAFSWHDSGTSATTSVLYKIYFDNGGTDALIPNSDLPGNSTGFSSSPVDLSVLNIATYPKIKVAAFLHTNNPNVTPYVSDWAVTNMEHEPFPNFSFNLRGDKTIGKDGSGNVLYKYNEDLTTEAHGTISLSPMEWDTYTITASGYDITEACPTQPKLLHPGEIETMNVDFSAHSGNSLLVAVKDTSGAMVPGAVVRLYRAGFEQYQKTGACGQVFVSGLSSGTGGAGNAYTIDVGAPSYATTTVTDITVSGASNASATLSPL